MLFDFWNFHVEKSGSLMICQWLFRKFSILQSLTPAASAIRLCHEKNQKLRYQIPTYCASTLIWQESHQVWAFSSIASLSFSINSSNNSMKKCAILINGSSLEPKSTLFPLTNNMPFSSTS